MSNRKSTQLENKVAKDLEGGQRVIASGALPFWKNDVKADQWLLEHKYTEAKSYAIKKKMFKDLTEEAFKLGKLPAFMIEYIDRPELKLVIIRYEEFLELDRYIKEENESKS